MPFCPKCEQEFRPGIEECGDCAVDLVATLARPATLQEVEEKHAEEMFADDGIDIVLCPTCLNEFAPEAAVCVPCGGVRLARLTAEECENVLATSPLTRIAKPETVAAPDGHVRAFVAKTPAEAGFMAESLLGMGVDAIVGNDELDVEGDASHIGIWVPELEAEHAAMLLPEDGDEDDFALPSSGSEYEDLVSTASAYRDLQKFRHAIKLTTDAIELDPHASEAFLVLGSTLGRKGDVAGARRAYETVVDRNGPEIAQFYFGIYSLLDDAGKPAFTGEAADRGIAVLRSFARSRPREMAAWIVLLEAHDSRGEREAAADVCRNIRGIHRHLLDMPGPFGEIADRVEA